MRPNQPIPGDGNANLFTCFRVQSDSISSGSAPWLLLLVKAVKAFVQKKKCTKSATGCRVLIASGQDVVSLAATTQVRLLVRTRSNLCRSWKAKTCKRLLSAFGFFRSFSGLVVEYIVAIDVTRVRLRADASCRSTALLCHSRDVRNQLVHQQGKIAR